MSRPTKAVLISAFVLALLTSSGCATLFRSSTEKVLFETSPPGAQLAVDGVIRGVTPLTVSFTRNSRPHLIELWQEGYQPEAFKLPHVFDGVGITLLIVDIVVSAGAFGLVGLGITLGVEFSTEHFWAFERERVHVALKEGSPDARPPPWTLPEVQSERQAEPKESEEHP